MLVGGAAGDTGTPLRGELSICSSAVPESLPSSATASGVLRVILSRSISRGPGARDHPLPVPPHRGAHLTQMTSSGGAAPPPPEGLVWIVCVSSAPSHRRDRHRPERTPSHRARHDEDQREIASSIAGHPRMRTSSSADPRRDDRHLVLSSTRRRLSVGGSSPPSSGGVPWSSTTRGCPVLTVREIGISSSEPGLRAFVSTACCRQGLSVAIAHEVPRRGQGRHAEPLPRFLLDVASRRPSTDHEAAVQFIDAELTRSSRDEPVLKRGRSPRSSTGGGRERAPVRVSRAHPLQGAGPRPGARPRLPVAGKRRGPPSNRIVYPDGGLVSNLKV